MAGITNVGAEPTTSYEIASVRSSFELLFVFMQSLPDGGEIGVSELSRLTGQTKNLTFRLLQTMVSAGVVTQNPETRNYALGYRLIELGSAAKTHSSLVHAARPVLDRLHAATGDRVLLGRLSSGFATILLDSRDARPRPWERAGVGTRFALHAGAGSKLLLAYSPPEYIDEYLRIATPLKRFTQYTAVQPSLIREECERIRHDGYSVSWRDLEPDQCSIAVPIRNRAGEVIAGIGISSMFDAFGEEVRTRNLAMLRQAAEDITVNLGQRPV